MDAEVGNVSCPLRDRKRSWSISAPLTANLSSLLKPSAVTPSCSIVSSMCRRDDSRYETMSLASTPRTSSPAACCFTASSMISLTRFLAIDLTRAERVCNSAVVKLSFDSQTRLTERKVKTLDRTRRYWRIVSGFNLEIENQQTLSSSCYPNLAIMHLLHIVIMLQCRRSPISKEIATVR